MRVVGVDIGGTSIKLGVVNEKGDFEKSLEYDTESEKGGQHVLRKLIEQIEQLGDIDAIGISTAGQVDRKNGVLVESVNIPDTLNLALKETLEKHFKVPVDVENDVNAAALGEKTFGVGKNLDEFLFITYGTGVGGAIVIDSKIYYGKSGFAADFGHMTTHPEGIKCNCGLEGCYERYASTTALVEKAKEIDESYTNGKVIFEKYHARNTEVVALIDDWIKEIALGLASLIHIFNPPTIILGGGVMEQNIIVQKISEQVNKIILEMFSDVEILAATLGNKAGILGAASLHIKK